MTADRATLLGLADEVERLTQRGNFEMECRILLALHPVRIDGGAAFWTVGDLAGTRIRIPNCTVSIDAAADMMPKGWFYEIKVAFRDRVAVEAYTLLGNRGHVISDVARTEPLARTAAALRAMAVGVGDPPSDPR